MPKTNYKRKMYKKKNYRKKKYNSNNKMVPLKKDMHLFKRYAGAFSQSSASSAGATFTFSGSTITLGVPATAGVHYYSLSLSFDLANVAAYTEFTALFDYYKINGVAFRIFPMFNSVETYQGASSPGGLGCVLHSVIDLDDSNVIPASETGVNQMREHRNYKAHNMAYIKKGMWTRYLRPKANLGIWDGSTIVNGGGVLRSNFIDCARATIPHYGLKMIYELSTSAAVAQNLIFKVESKFYLTFKGQI